MIQQQVWISKYVLSKGVYAIHAQVDNNDPKRIRFAVSGRWPKHMVKPDWHEHRSDAVKDARERVVKKLNQLDKHRDKLLRLLETL